jgi:predicted RNA binding protein YcfA (HicA-like mRNA interferase family)
MDSIGSYAEWEEKIGTEFRNLPLTLKIRDALKILKKDGWEVVRQRGSHRQLKNPEKPGTVTVAGKPGVDIPPGTLKSIWKQAGLDL